MKRKFAEPKICSLKEKFYFHNKNCCILEEILSISNRNNFALNLAQALRVTKLYRNSYAYSKSNIAHNSLLRIQRASV